MANTRARLVSDVVTMLQFMSRIPVAESIAPHQKPDFSTMAYALPIAGALAAIPAALLVIFLLNIGLSAPIVAVLVLVLLIATNGGLHEDGLADVFDGFGGGKSREGKLTIMRDSQIGTYGTLALVFSSLLRVALLIEVIARISPAGLVFILLAAAGFSRAAMIWVWQSLPAARDDGLSNRYGEPDTRQFLHATIAAAIIALPLILFYLSLIAVPLIVIISTGPIWLFARLCKNQIGGHTGDVLGASQIIAEILFYVGLLLAMGI